MARYEFKEANLSELSSISVITDEYARKIDLALAQITTSTTKLGAAAAEAVTKGGKRIRPGIALMICEAVSGSCEPAIPVGVAYELAHAASLAQDDIIDDSPTRRGAPTVYKKYGITSAILISDLLIFKIFDILGTYGRTPISKGRLASILTYIGTAARKTAEGEFLEGTLAVMDAVTETDYVNVAGLKTGSLFAATAASGAVAGGARRSIIDDMYEYGYNVGISFQMVDDILDVAGDSVETGKPTLKDLQNNTTNIVLIHAITNANTHQKGIINALTWKRSYGVADERTLRGILDRLGSLDYAAELSGRYAAMARDHLAGLPKSRAKQRLEDLTYALAARRR